MIELLMLFDVEKYNNKRKYFLRFEGFMVDLRKNKRQLWNETEEHLRIIEEILSKVLGVKKLRLYVDGEPLKKPRERKT